ncbi:hypothetical protein [Actinocrispum sp. NPDC049592]|uniref:PadR family transcriptional regulator n=1 Tax=Actinocrispum sp. NPDC049592 TaxID=3154835 RepID=UPI00343A2EC1
MGKQVTETLKGVLEGIVLAILSGRPAYGYEITAWLGDQGFSDIAEGTACSTSPARNRCSTTWPTCSNGPRRTERRSARSSGTDPVELQGFCRPCTGIAGPAVALDRHEFVASSI